MTTADNSDDGRDAGTAGERSEASGGGGLSRRDVLRRFGVAAGVAWTAPVVMSLYSPAGAQTVGSPGPNTTTTGEPPDLECVGAVCGELASCSSANPDCVCVATTDGLGLCAPGAGECIDFDECGPDNSCPPGTTCATGTCCGVPVCLPLALAGECPPDPPPDPPPFSGRAPCQRVSTGPGTIGG